MTKNNPYRHTCMDNSPSCNACIFEEGYKKALVENEIVKIE